jgi:O-Antigen ligase
VLTAASIIHQSDPMIHAHDAATTFLDRRRQAAIAGPALGALAIATFLLAPRAAPGQLVVLVALPALAAGGRAAAATLASPLAAACAAFGCYIVINASWSVNLAQAYGKVVFYWFALALVCLAIAGLRRLADRTLERLQQAIVAAVAIAAALLAFEVLSGCLIQRILFSMVPGIRPNHKHIQVADGWVTAIEPYMLNRNITALCLVIWPSLLMLRTLLGTQMAHRIGLPGLAVAASAVLPSDHATSVIALTLAGVAFVGVTLAAPIMRGLIVVAWTAAALLAVPVASLAFDHHLQHAEWLPQSARNRIILWGYTAGEIKMAPLLGVGVASTRDLDAARAAAAARPDGYGYPLRTGRHSHSIFMQTWYELGGIGAVLLLGIGLMGIGVLWRLPPPDQPLAFAAFVTVVTIGASGWGMWQTWFMAGCGIWAVLLALALEGARRRRLGQA